MKHLIKKQYMHLNLQKDIFKFEFLVMIDIQAAKDNLLPAIESSSVQSRRQHEIHVIEMGVESV